ncbi:MULTISPECIES: hypothetical protein [Sorangium]|uniref:Uncharacterized protein n=1 Tax=Sorangium atrum TaxID=2995308 RepID=A0ABT5BZ35_9BACT|nr:hypothetical protein [Sorangium aterium]MDC0679419.1 hypothetical protein [Sorangium aterium]
MRSGTLLVPFILLLGACGGSSSETPWPAEPRGPALGPTDEASPEGPADSNAAPQGAREGSADEADAGR